MAILKDLIVHGSSRFLNKIYAEELETSAFEAESAIIKKLTAKDATMENATVIGLLDVQGQLHTNTWTNSNIATIDGCFYITPTLSSDSGKISFTSNTAASLTGSYSAVTSLYIGGSSSGSTVQWTKDSNILLTGEVEVNGQWLPLGTLLGTLSANATTSLIGLTGLTDNRHNPSSIITDIRNAVSNASLDYRNLKISLYQRKDGSDSKPIGIYMTAMGANGKTFIDIYGGVNATTTAGSSGGFADPNLRIGNLSGLGAVEGTTPTGWGIYTTNGYFKGVIVSSAGKIGNFTINSALYSNNHSAWNSNVSGIYINNDGISGGAGGKWWLWNDGSAKIGEMTLSAAGVLTVPAANVSGELTAATINGSKITANTITADQIATSAITADELAANAVTSTKIKAGEVKATNIASSAVTADKLDATTINASNKLTVGAMTTDTQTSIENKNIYDNKFYRYKKDITVYGDSNKYYPVYFKNNSNIYSQNDTHRISIYRGYSQQAPSDWYTSTHKGGLTLNIKWNYGGWGGATYNCEITEFTELYSTMVGDVQVAVGSGMTSAIFLRGGGTTGALYHIYCDVPLDVTHYNGTFPAIGNNENVGTDYMYTGDYHWKYATPLTTPNTIHIKSLIAKNIAANYITDIDSNKGITIKPADTSGNDYLQINSSAINFYRNNVETLKIEDSAIRVGKLGNNLRNVYITDSAVQIRNNTSVLAEYGSSIKLYKPGTTTAAVEISSTGATFTGGIVATSLTLESGVTIGYSSISNPPTIPTTVAELTDSGSYLTTSAASSTYATQTNLNNEINARKAVYGTSSTDAGTATKAVTCSNFALYTGASVTVTFSKTNTSSAPQLNVNSTGAKPIKSYTGANLTEGEYKWAAGASITFTYDGTNWRMQDGGALQAKIDAASSASTASSQAGVATQQATNATNAKTAAESAKTAAESAKTAAQSAKTAAETASSQASSAKDTAVSAKNDAVSAKTDAETAKGQAQTAAGNASQSATNAANSATAAAEVMGGFTILWNYSAFGTSKNGRGYLCAFDPATGTKSDANGWVKWNSTKRTITKQLINPSAISPNNIPIYIVCRLSSATATTGTNYMVWYNSGWKSATLSNPSTINSSWTWADNTDIILGKFVETASEAALTEYEIYNPPYTSKQITTNVVTAQSASASAASAAQTATSYITYVNATDGIKVHNASDTNNYLQLNSSAINFYRNNVETLKIEDSAIRVGKIGENEQNVYIADGAVQIRDNEDILAKFGSDGVIVGDINNLNIKITNDRMIMYSKSAPSIQLITGDDVRPVTRHALYATFPFSTVTTKTYIVDSDTNNFFKYSTGINALFDVTDSSNTIYDRLGRSFTFGTSASKTMSYDTSHYTFSCSCTIEYDGAYTFIIKDWTYSNLKRVNFYIEYDLEEAAPNVILGTTDAVSFGAYSVTEGDSCQAGGENSHAEGNYSIATGDSSHAEGSYNTSSGNASHAEGCSTESRGLYSHAQNYHTIAASKSQTAIGEYNVSDSSDTYSFIIGNGTSNSARSNALTVDWYGNIISSGGATIGGNTSITGTLDATGTITQNGTAVSLSGHNHAASDITSGTLAVGRGGTGITSNPSMLTNLGSTTAASVFAASPRPGVTGVLGISNGGTGMSGLTAIGTSTSSTITSYVAAASGFTVKNVYFAQWGKVAMFRITFTKNGTAITTNTNMTLGTLTENYRPKYNAMGQSGWERNAIIQTDGTIHVYGTIAANTDIGVYSTYILA